MQSSSTNKKMKRKNIDLSPEVFKSLSIMAAEAGKDLKNFIQDKLAELAKKRK